MAVHPDRCLAHRSLDGIEAIGIDEVQWHKGHHYLTLVYQIDAGSKRLLWIGKERTAKTLLRFFRMFGKDRSRQLKFICSDMWKAYLKVVAKKAGQAVHVLDRFHVLQKMSKAINEVRAAEAKRGGWILCRFGGKEKTDSPWSSYREIS